MFQGLTLDAVPLQTKLETPCRFPIAPQRKVATAMEGYARCYGEDPDLWFLACDEITGISFAYQKVNPVPYREMKVKSIKSRFKEKVLAAKIDRSTIYLGCEHLGVSIEEHVETSSGFSGNSIGNKKSRSKSPGSYIVLRC